MTFKDARARPLNRKQLGQENQSFVFSLFEDEMKLTVRDVVEACYARGKKLNERTIRRAIDALEGEGFLMTVGRQNNAILYAKQSTSMVRPDQGLIPFGGELLSVEKFMRLLADSEEPFKVKVTTLDQQASLNLRRQLLFTILSAGQTGQDTQLKKVSKNLHAYLEELKFVTQSLETLLNSPIWYDQYRDRIGLGVREAQKNDPELFQLAVDIVKGG